MNSLADVALARLQGELAKEGREPTLASKGARDSFAGKPGAVKTSESKEGRKLVCCD